jgi:hypothetical protein
MKKYQRFIFEDQVDMSKPKKMVYDTIFTKNYEGENREIVFGDLPTDLQPTDILVYHSDSGHYSENNSWDPFTEVTIRRPRLETDEEYEERIERSRLFLENLKEGRRETYLKLKKEFEPTDEKN